jgi:membrane dipeptidase
MPPVFDAHVDSLQLALDLGCDLGTRSPGHLDLPRALAGGLASLVFVSWVDPLYIEPERGGARRRTDALLDQFQQLLEGHPEFVLWAGNGEHLRAARRSGRLAAIAGIEGGHSIEESLDTLEHFFRRGVRVMTLVWNNHLSWIRSCRDGAGPGTPEGLSAFGLDVVRSMNRLGMLVDLSHAGERAFFDALETSDRPLIASHSGCRAVNDHPRNLSDDQLRALAAAGGVVGIVFCTPFLDRAAAEAEAALRESAEYRGLRGSNETETFLLQGQFLQREAPPLPLERVVDHLLHAVEIAGIEHVGLGSDFDGIQRTPAGLEDASAYPRLAAALRARGFDEQELALVLGGNMERVFAAATGPGTRAAEAMIED